MTDKDYEKIDEHTTRKVLAYGEQLMVVAIAFNGSPETLELHDHPHEQITYVQEGGFEYVIEETTQILHAGESIYVRPHARHGARCISGKGHLIDAFSPIREDYLTKGE